MAENGRVVAVFSFLAFMQMVTLNLAIEPHENEQSSSMYL